MQIRTRSIKSRNLSRVPRQLAVILALSLAVPAVFAQDNSGQDSSGQDSSLGGDTSSGGDAEIRFRKASQLSAEEQLRQSEEYLKKMRITLHKVKKTAKRARKDKDIIKLNCVNDKLIQIKGNMRLAEQAKDALRAAAARKDLGARNHEFAKLTIMYQKVTVLGQEAEACIGEEIAYIGQTKVLVSVSPDIPTAVDPSTGYTIPLPAVRPPLASPDR